MTKRTREWPAILREPHLLDAPIELRPIHAVDVRISREVQAANDSWYRPWGSTDPDGPRPLSPVGRLVSAARRSPSWSYISAGYLWWLAKRQISYAWVIRYGGEFAGQVTMCRFVGGSVREGEVSVWLNPKFAGRGIMPTAVALAVDHCFQVLGLHRIEAGIRPENAASRRVVEKLGFRDEGVRVRHVHVDGAWRDHIYYAITVEEVPDGLLSRWRSSQAVSRAARLTESRPDPR